MGVIIENGVLKIDGRSLFIIASDYPYYRDTPENWPDRLRKIKAAGVNVLTFYIPWRHHLQSDGTFDFEGRTAPNRDVKLFLRMCEKFGFFVIVKPGPFIHAETDFNGLPDNVSPDDDPEIEKMLDGKGKAVVNQKTLPSPVGAKFMDSAKKWLSAVNNQIIVPHLYPKGGIICVQILNEGMYSDISNSPFDYDYSPTSVKMFRDFLKRKYMSCNTLNFVYTAGLSSFDEVEPPDIGTKPETMGNGALYADWADFQAFYIKNLYERYGSCIDGKVPLMANICAMQPCRQGLDFWLSRVQPECLRNVSYGYTDWVGAVPYDKEALIRYLILAKRRRGPNMEENWGFSRIYDNRFKFPSLPFYHTLLALANGATGFNVYTGTQTAQWDENIDSKHPKPYPDSSPIGSDGEIKYKYKMLKLITGYINNCGRELLDSHTQKAASFGVYPPYAYASSFAGTSKWWNRFKVNPPRCGRGGLHSFAGNMTALNYDFGIVNIKTASAEELLKEKLLVVTGGFFMDGAVQRKLAEYAAFGGTLVMLREVPRMDEMFRPCLVLAEEIFTHKTGKACGNTPVDGFANEKVNARALYEIPGEILYTSGGRTIGYLRKYGKGQACFLSYNPLESELSDVFLNIIRRLSGEYSADVRSSCTYVWRRRCENGADHVFVFSDSNIPKWHHVILKNGGEKDDDIEIRLCPKSAAALRIKNGRLTACLAKGINECESTRERTVIKLNGSEVLNVEPSDFLMESTERGRVIHTLSDV